MHGLGLYEGLAIAGWDFVEMILLSFMTSFFGSCDAWSFGSVECDGGKVGYDWCFPSSVAFRIALQPLAPSRG